MSQLTVKCGVMNQCVSSEKDIVKRINNVAEDIDNIRRSLSFNIRSRARINEQLVTLSKVCRANASHVNSMQKVLSDAVVTYTNAEKNVSGNLSSVVKAKKASKPKSSSKAKKTDDNDPWEFSLKDLGKVIGQAGVVGSFLKSVANFVNPKSGIDVGKGLIELIGTGAKLAGSSAVDWFGTALIGDKGFGGNLLDEFGKYKIDFKSGSSSSNISAVAKWGGAALTAIEKFVGNAEEYNYDFSNGRMYAETIGETAITVIGGMAATAAVAAVLPATAPVWAAGVIGGAVLVVGDKIFKSLNNGQGGAEVISDFVLDKGGEIISNIGKSSAVKKIGDGISNAGEAIASWFK
ncbi:MAG: hypothetical protein PUE08_07775 [Eubacteriales bacterium]|nr:hypothetical protein [Eubacteriales bacterium]